MKTTLFGIFLLGQAMIAFSQDTTNYKPEFDFGITLVSPIKQYSNEVKTEFENNYNLHVTNFYSVGFYFGIGLPIKINKFIDIVPKLNYQRFNINLSKAGDLNCASCQVPVSFNGVINTKTTYNNINFEPIFRLKFRLITLDNSIGVAYYFNQKNYQRNKDFITKNEWESNSKTKNIFYSLTSSHKIGFKVIPKKVDFLLGINLIYQNTISNFIYPNSSIRYKF